MTKQEIITVAARIAAFFIVLLGIRYALGGAYDLYVRDKGVPVLVWIALVFFPLLLAGLLWYLPLTMTGSARMLDTTDAPITSLSATDLLSAALASIGILMLAFGIPNTIYWIVYTYFDLEQISESGAAPGYYAGAIAATVEVMAGAVLVLTNGRLARFMQKQWKQP